MDREKQNSVQTSRVTWEESIKRSAQLDRELRARLVIASELLAAAEAENAELRRQLDLAHSENAAMKRSTSWRVTRPLRRLKGGE